MDDPILSHQSTANVKQQCAEVLPLYMLLSMDERNLNKECPYTSDTYHKCTSKCTPRMNVGEGQREEDTSAVVEGKNTGKENSYIRSPKSPRAVPLIMFVSPNGRNLNPKCPNASNPYHKCTERCIQRMNEKKKRSERDPSVVTESSKNSYLRSPEATKKQNVPSGILSFFSPDIRNVGPKCPNADNPFHKCTETCIQKMNAGKKLQEGETSAAIGKNIENSNEKRPRSPLRLPISLFTSPNKQNVIPKCPYESNLYHKCNERCMERMNEGNMESNGEHGEFNERYMESIQKMNAGKKQREEDISAAIGKYIENSNEKRPRSPLRLPISLFTSPNKLTVIPKCPHESNPYHKCNERCMERMNEGKMQSNGEHGEFNERCMESVQKTNAGKKQREGDTSAAIGKNIKNSNEKRSRSPLRLPISLFTSANKQNVIPKCPHESNPYHKCNERCMERMNEGKMQNKGEKPEEGKAHESLPGASTPFRIITNSPQRRNVNSPYRRNVHPSCRNASNPYHKCTETCLQRLNNKGKDQNESNTPVVIVVSKEEKMEEDIDAFTPCMENFYMTSPGSHESKNQKEGQVDASDTCQKCTEGQNQSVSEKAAGIENNEETENREGKLDVNPKHLDVSDSESNSTERSLSEDHGSVEKGEESNEGVKGVDDNNSEKIKKVLAVEEKVHIQPTCIDESNQHQNYDVNCQVDKDEGSKNKTNEADPGAERSIDDFFKRFTNTDVVKGGDSVELAKERKEDLMIAGEFYEQSQCKNVSKPYHKCNEHCLSSISKRGKKVKEEKLQTDPFSQRIFCFFRINSRKTY